MVPKGRFARMCCGFNNLARLSAQNGAGLAKIVKPSAPYLHPLIRTIENWLDMYSPKGIECKP
jgi:hypothetical protein